MPYSIYLENYVRRFIILFLKYSILSVLKLDRFLWRKIIFLHKQKNTNFYFEFKTNNKIQCFFSTFAFKTTLWHFFTFFTMVNKFVSVKYWSLQNLWNYEPYDFVNVDWWNRLLSLWNQLHFVFDVLFFHYLQFYICKYCRSRIHIHDLLWMHVHRPIMVHQIHNTKMKLKVK